MSTHLVASYKEFVLYATRTQKSGVKLKMSRAFFGAGRTLFRRKYALNSR